MTVPVLDDEKTDPDRHFRTDHLIDDLKGRSVRGGAITLAAQAIKFILQLGSTVILARLLTPADFGLVAMVTAVTGFVAMFKDLGLSQATVQRATINQQQVSTLFWINVALSAALMLLVAGLSPLIAWFYGDDRLVGITLALAGTFIFGGLTVQHGALLTRQMRFRVLAIIDILSLAAGVTTALVMAWMGLGYWALVGMPAGQAIANCLLVWTASGWTPGKPTRGSGVRDMLKFGGGVSAYNTVGYVARHVDNVLIGRVWGASPLGFYTRAYQLLLLPLSQVSTPLFNVVVPTLSRLQSDRPSFERYYLRVLATIMWLTGPMIAALAACSDQLVHLMLGPGWEEAGVLFRIMAVAALVQPLHFMIPWGLVALGRARALLVWGTGSSSILIICFLIGVPFGVRGVAVAYAVGFAGLGMVWSAFTAIPVIVSQRRRVASVVAAPVLGSVMAFGLAVILVHVTSGMHAVMQCAASAASGLTVVGVYLAVNGDARRVIAAFRGAGVSTVASA